MSDSDPIMGNSKNKRQSKKRLKKFHGIPYHLMKTNDNIGQENCTDIPTAQDSASKAKLINLSPMKTKPQKGTLTSEENVIIDVANLTQFLQGKISSSICHSPVKCGFNSALSCGSAHVFKSQCTVCVNIEKLFESSNRCGPHNVSNLPQVPNKRPYLVNIHLVSYARAIGKGYESLVLLSKYLNSPSPMTATSYAANMTLQHAAAKFVGEESMKQAADEVKAKDITVSVDSSWHKRGHSSQNGVVTVCEVDTGKCTHVEVLSNYCKHCQIIEKKDKDSLAYQIGLLNTSRNVLGTTKDYHPPLWSQ